MLKKSPTFLGIIGLCLILIYFVINPDMLGQLIIGKKLNSDFAVIKFQLFSYYSLIVGIILLVSSVLIRKLNPKNHLQYLLLVSIVLGIVITIAALFFSPNYLIQNYTKYNFIVENSKLRIWQYQIYFSALSTIVLFISLAIYIFQYVKNSKLIVALTFLIGIVFYLIVNYNIYLKVKYPKNILTNFSELHKVKQLILGENILFTDFDPVSTLKVKNKKIIKAKYPVIDMNFHMYSAYQTNEDRNYLSPENLVRAMDSVGLAIAVNSDGFKANIGEHIKKYPKRFIIFDPTGFPPKMMTDEEFAALPKKLEEKVKMGAKGDGEIWKFLGLRTRDKTGKVISVDDPRIDPFWSKAGELGVPIMWHMIDVESNFLPIDKHNERYEMLSTYPEFSHYDPENIPPRSKLIKDRENVFRKHPNTIFIGCHMGMNPEDLEYVGYLFDTFPNYYVEMSTVLSELGRQPYTARKFFIKYQDRILFGTDGGSLFGVDGWTVEKFYQAHWEFLETENEYIKYPMQGAINQGDWRIYGINLPDSVLQKIYYLNAAKILKLDLDEWNLNQ